MGIEQAYRRVTPEEFDYYLSHPETHMAFWFGGERELAQDQQRLLDIGKEWQALHLLLTGEITFQKEGKALSPLCDVIMGGTDTPYEATYDYVRYFKSDEVKAIAAALGEIPVQSLRTRHADKFHEAEGLYANDSPDNWDEEYWEYMLDIYRYLVEFFDAAAVSGEYVLIASL